MEEKKSKRRLAAGLVLVIVLVGIGAVKVGSFLPTIGALDTPANANVSQYYINNALSDTHAHNIVTAVLADYRGFDTLFETCVMLLSGIAVMTILSAKEKVTQNPRQEMTAHRSASSFGSALMDGAFRIVVPIILIYGIYVLFHGEVSLGGGFQAGALLACAYLLNRIIPKSGLGSLSDRVRDVQKWQKAREELGIITAGLGIFFYMFTGILPMLNGGRFLEFGKLPFAENTAAELHADGILMIEIGVTVCVAGVIITILEVVLERTDFDD